MKKLALLVTVCSLVVSGSILSSASAEDVSSTTKEDILNEIAKIKVEDAAYYLDELKQQSYTQKARTLSQFGFNTSEVSNENILKEVAQEMVDQSYIYYMDESGVVYDKNANVLAQLDVSSAPDADPATSVSTKGKVTTLAYNNPRINGDNSGPFIRQTSVKGYIGSRTQFTLPSKTSGGIDIPTTGATGYIYNGLDYNIETGSNSFSMEGGVQASQANNNFSAYIRVNGGSLVFTDDGNNPGNYPPRYKAGTAYTSNLRYEVSTGKVKYYASGTNVNGVAQNLSFTYSKSFTSTELAN
ncbi:hypothetical protein, partial [Cohnella laeviribosi]|uniref:hypothetical protein n=1 Tax=Cohnella laeviribosi TaxID=380174 RepID=UPI000525CB4A